MVTAVKTITRKPSIGYKVRKLRISVFLTQQELADLAGVCRDHVDLFEHNLPVPLDSKRRIFKVLWARKVKE